MYLKVFFDRKGAHMTANLYSRNAKHSYLTLFLGSILCLTLLIPPNTANAKTYFLAVQPIFSKERTISTYQPLAIYLSKATGHDIKIHASNNYVAHWEELRKNQAYDLALDAAHFTSYRTTKLKYTVLAKITDTVSFSLISNEDTAYFDAEELIAKRIATPASPSIGAVRLLSMYPNISRQPIFISTNNFPDSLKMLKSNKVDAALIPTPLISGDSSVNTILVTEPVPHMAISASNRVDKATKDKIRTALLNANSTEEGKILLNELNLPGFEKATNKTYKGYIDLLSDVWGY